MEEKIKRIEELVVEWKAKYDYASSEELFWSEDEAKYTIKGLNLAIGILKKPSNKAVEHGQAWNAEDPCACNQDREEMIKEGFSFCHWCGRGLHQ